MPTLLLNTRNSNFASGAHRAEAKRNIQPGKPYFDERAAWTACLVGNGSIDSGGLTAERRTDTQKGGPYAPCVGLFPFTFGRERAGFLVIIHILNASPYVIRYFFENAFGAPAFFTNVTDDFIFVFFFVYFFYFFESTA